MILEEETREKKPPTVEDLCANCRRRILVYVRSWEGMKSIWGRVICGNYCTRGCMLHAYSYPEPTAHRIWKRQTELAAGAPGGPPQPRRYV